MMNTEFVQCKQVVKAYRVAHHEIVALRGIDFTMAQGEIVAIIGPSGAGKSSLLNLLGGLDQPTAGQLSVGGQNLLELKGRHLAQYRLRNVGFVWQQVERNLFSHRSALHNVTLPMLLAGVPLWERRKGARGLLEAVDMLEHQHKKPVQLSGGQQQRVAIAVALANQPQLLLADEPTGSVDRESGIQVMNLISELREHYGLTILMVTHDMEIAAFADRVLTLRDGALGQDLSQIDQQQRGLDAEGRVALPQSARVKLAQAAHIAVEMRPEGVLLRPEQADVEDSDGILREIMPQDAPSTYEQRGWFARILRRRHSLEEDNK